MSDYCTHCDFLQHNKDTAGRTIFICKKAIPNQELNILCGNPLKMLFCKKENWYKKKTIKEIKKKYPLLKFNIKNVM